MIKKLRVACLQTNAGRNWQVNLRRLDRQVDAALRQGARLLAFPETFACRDTAAKLTNNARYVTPVLIDHFRQRARQEGAAFLLGSIMETSPVRNRVYNTSVLISEKGKVAAKYRKIHLFDIALRGKVTIRESRHILPGCRVVTGTALGVKVGLSVCYDLRFPELYRRLAHQGARIFFVPANFTHTTGKAHWEVLLRARAIENQAFVVAPGQSGTHPDTGIRSYGSSLVIDPWGEPLRQAPISGEHVLVTDLDLSEQARLRRSFPVLRHRCLKG